MRIISGKYKGRRISPPKGLPVRPTTDMSKEALFNVLKCKISKHKLLSRLMILIKRVSDFNSNVFVDKFSQIKKKLKIMERFKKKINFSLGVPIVAQQ